LAAIKIVESAPEGSVIVAALDDAKDFAVFGATFAALAKTRKLAGVYRGRFGAQTAGIEVSWAPHVRTRDGAGFGGSC